MEQPPIKIDLKRGLQKLTENSLRLFDWKSGAAADQIWSLQIFQKEFQFLTCDEIEAGKKSIKDNLLKEVQQEQPPIKIDLKRGLQKLKIY